jgi:RND family efflux transporter MFP subunit
MRHPTFAIILLAASLAPALVVAPACKRQSTDPAELPPASGKGAPASPALPSLEAAASTDAGQGASRDRTTGTAFAIVRAEVAPTMSAIIQSIEVVEGQKVTKGQVLFRMRTSDLALRVDQARAAQKSAAVALAAAKVEFDRMQRLLEKNAVEQAQFDRTSAQYEAAKVAAEQAKVAVSMARQGLSDASVRSPIAGVVTAVPKNAGEMATMMPPTVVVVVEDQSKLKLQFRLPESALATVKLHGTVKVKFEAIGAERDATVDRISPAVDPRTRTFEVTTFLDNADGSLKSGMLATIDAGTGGK